MLQGKKDSCIFILSSCITRVFFKTHFTHSSKQKNSNHFLHTHKQAVKEQKNFSGWLFVEHAVAECVCFFLEDCNQHKKYNGFPLLFLVVRVSFFNFKTHLPYIFFSIVTLDYTHFKRMETFLRIENDKAVDDGKRG